MGAPLRPNREAGASRALRPENTVPQNSRKMTAPPLARIEPGQQPRLSPVPDTKPATIPGWSVRSINGESVVLVGRDRTWTAMRGDSVPGVGRIDAIVRWGDRWIVATSSGLISTE